VSYYKGRIVEILLEGYQNGAALLACATGAIPRPGQYLQAHNPDDPMDVVPVSLFASGTSKYDGELGIVGEAVFPISGPIPSDWKPGTSLLLRGPLGRGFELPKRARRVALAALDGNPERLLPLIGQALKQDAQVALFSDDAGGDIPVAVEQQGLSDLAAGVQWADYLATDISIEKVEELDTVFRSRIPAALKAEILVAAPMPCGALAKCGICTVRTRSRPRLACEDGPVFDLKEVV